MSRGPSGSERIAWGGNFRLAIIVALSAACASPKVWVSGSVRRTKAIRGNLRFLHPQTRRLALIPFDLEPSRFPDSALETAPHADPPAVHRREVNGLRWEGKIALRSRPIPGKRRQSSRPSNRTSSLQHQFPGQQSAGGGVVSHDLS